MTASSLSVEQLEPRDAPCAITLAHPPIIVHPADLYISPRHADFHGESFALALPCALPPVHPPVLIHVSVGW